MSTRHWRLLLLAWCALIFALSAQSTLPVGDGFPGQDKLEHMSAYGIMAWLFWRAFPPGAAYSPTVIALAAVVFCLAYGLSDEWHQSFVPGRMPDGYDLLADGLGAMLVSIVLLYRHGLARRLEAST